MRWKQKDLLEAFDDTRHIHDGRIDRAAPMLHMTESALTRALYRARKAGHKVAFTPVAESKHFYR